MSATLGRASRREQLGFEAGVGLLVLLVSVPLLAQRSFVGADLVCYAYHHLHSIQGALAQGELLTWNPSIFAGYPTVAALQAGSYYPPNLLALSLFPFAVAIKLLFMGHYWMLARGLAAVVRDQGGSRRAALVAATVGLLGGTTAVHVMHYNAIVCFAWCSVILWLSLRCMQRPTQLLTLALGACYGLAALQAHPQWLAYLGLVVAVLALFFHRDRWGLLVPVVAAPAIGVLLAACVLVPAWEYQQIFPRPLVGGRYQFFTQGGLRVADLPGWALSAVRPGFQIPTQASETLYAGSVFWALALVAVWHPRRPRLVRAGCALFALGLFLAPTQLNPLYRVLVYVPPFSMFREPSRIIWLGHLGLVFLAARGLDVFRGAGPVPQARAVALSLGAILGSALGAAWACDYALSPVLLGLVLLNLALFGGMLFSEPLRRRGVPVLLGMGLLELSVAWVGFNPTIPDAELLRAPALSEPVAAEPHSLLLDMFPEDANKLIAVQRLRRNSGTRFGVRYFSGYESSPPLVQELLVSQLTEAFEAGGPSFKQRATALSVRWLLVPAGTPAAGWERVGEDAGAWLYRNPDALPPAYGHARSAAGRSLHPVEIETWSPSRVVLRTNGAAQRLVLTQAWYPGWTATVGEERLEPDLVEGLYCSVEVPAGVQEVVFDYANSQVSLGNRITLSASLVWLLLVVLAWSKRNEGRGSEPGLASSESGATPG